MVEYRLVTNEEIPQLIQISLNIFQPHDGENNSHHQLDLWKQHLYEGGFIIGLYVDGQLVGYNFGYPVGKQEFHYWMGGILNDYRGQGYGRELLKTQEELARKKGFIEMTVNTYEHLWPVQFAFLQRHGYQVYKTEEHKWEEKKVIKSFLKKKL